MTNEEIVRQFWISVFDKCAESTVNERVEFFQKIQKVWDYAKECE